MGRKEAPGQTRILGSAVHDALAFNFGSKILTGEDQVRDTIMAYYHDSAWPDQVAKHEDILWEDKPDDVMGLGWRLVDVYMNQVAHRVTPVDVEVQVNFRVPGVPVDIVGVVDLVQTDGKPLIDFKTSSRRTSVMKPEWRLQGRIYSYAYQRPIDWHVLTKGKNVDVVTSLEAPALLQPYNVILGEQTVKLISDLAWTANDFYKRFGERDWPAFGIGHQWRCGKYCAYTTDCPAWRGTIQ